MTQTITEGKDKNNNSDKRKSFIVSDMPSVQNVSECLTSMQQIRFDMEKFSGKKFNSPLGVAQAVRELITGYRKICLISQV